LTGVEAQNALLTSYGLELTGSTLKQTNKFDATKIKLANGLEWGADKSIVLTGDDIFDITGGGVLKDSMGATETSNILTIGKKKGERVG